MFSSTNGYLNCGICNKPLSVPPIFHTQTLGNICGRCEQRGLIIEGNEDLKLSRQFIYEKIARNLTFPCAYKVFGCNLNLMWNGCVAEHEAQCDYRNVECPLSNQNFREPCDWIGLFDKLEDHILQNHKNHFSDSLQLSITREYQNKIILWNILGRIVIINMKFKEDVKKYYCSIVANLNRNDCRLYQCRLELSANKLENPVVLQKPVVHHWFGNLVPRPENSIEIDVSNFEAIFEQSEEVIVKFIFLKNGNQEVLSNPNDVLNVLTRNDDASIMVNEELLPDLECPICLEFMAPPIFICESGHNVCSKCREEITICPICRGGMRGGRNFILEKLTATIKYPCSNRTRGCGYVNDLLKVKCHEEICILSEAECVIDNCPWKGPNLEIINHIEQYHGVLEIKTCQVHEFGKEEKKHIIIFDEKIFVFNLQININQPLKYAVQCIGDYNVNYKHELQIIGSSAFDIRLTLGHLCQPVSNSKRKKNVPKMISIPFQFLCQFFTQFRHLEYKINIKRINE